jgi:beta-1,4-N-acetylglucosaminyltransferase
MLMMMDDGFCDFGHVHRRYLISSGDAMSRNHLEEYEQNLHSLCGKKGGSSGTYDTKVVTRARKVHQPLWSTPSSALQSLRGILGVLLSPPATVVGQRLRYPRIVVSNGPATGFIVAVAIFCLKMIYLIPEDRCFFVYIESWARISTLSLTGKLLYYTNIADAFAVQHRQVAEAYGIYNIGPIVLNSRRDVESDEALTA